MEKLGTACQLRLVVLDIDGTLTDPAGDITPPVQAAVTALFAAGYPGGGGHGPQFSRNGPGLGRLAPAYPDRL